MGYATGGQRDHALANAQGQPNLGPLAMAHDHGCLQGQGRKLRSLESKEPKRTYQFLVVPPAWPPGKTVSGFLVTQS